jgi:hypothetical protein
MHEILTTWGDRIFATYLCASGENGMHFILYKQAMHGHLIMEMLVNKKFEVRYAKMISEASL